MLNHARTLLLNTAAKNNIITNDTAAEVVPAAFVPVKLTNELKLVRRLLFGNKPDARFINLRVRELMGYIHQTECAQYVYDLDPRVTYWPTTAADFDSATRSQIVVTQLFGVTQRLTVVGSFKPDHSVGVAQHKYLVTVGEQNPVLPLNAMRLEAPNPNNTVAVVQELNTVNPPEIYNIGPNSNNTAAALPATELKMLLNFVVPESEYARIVTEDNDNLLHESYAALGAIESEQLAASMPLLLGSLNSVLAQWLVNVKATPDPIIATLLPALELLGEPVFLALFGVVDDEPYATFKNLWFDHRSPVYRLAGLTLALIYRTEELRRNKNG